jgi:hypothetical protein
MKTVPSGVFVVCMYGAFAVGGTVTIGAPVVVDEDVDSVVVETDDVVVSVVEVEVEVSEVEVDEVVVVSMVVVVLSDFVEEEEEEEEEEEVVVVVVFPVSEDEVEVVSLAVVVVSVTLGVVVLLSLVERSSVVWASAVVSVVLSPAFWADTRAAMTITNRKRRISRGWEFPSPRGRSLMVTRQ